MPRYTVKKSELDAVVQNIRNLTGRDFFLQGAYGGWELQERRGDGSVSITFGYVSKREMLNRLHAIRTGINIGQDLAISQMQNLPIPS
jgi:hypothetical protein